MQAQRYSFDDIISAPVIQLRHSVERNRHAELGSLGITVSLLCRARERGGWRASVGQCWLEGLQAQLLARLMRANA